MEEPQWSHMFQITTRNLKQGDSWSLEFDESLGEGYQKPGWKKCIVHTGGRFNCTKCGRGWSSNKVMVVCHMRLSNKEGVVKVRPSRQKCKECSEAPMEKPSIRSDNIDTFMKNLVEKMRVKCYNEQLDRKKKPFRRYGGNNPHEPAHCEACMQGICPRNNF
ncbi:receptor-transporting protein 3-like [Cottoperca gobio]|uniref:Receptor-transporting protein 3-like n=1 Tax=Cottoperca gobio TaxID=56716 RepID=A0A6J2PJK6_COTGO|nr:receptor-transporting protein 3-like [Cottoperca gobio]XP_029285825.1 receptor-transporting protein 3-like [Cottoperca gobio]